MAPVDRREHRQQRVRGAGPSSVQASFGFNFGALGSQPAKQPAPAPQPSPRRTPARSTPRAANGSAQRQRSASLQRNSASKRTSTPKDNTVTPQLGKRKRGSPNAQPGADDGAEDELSPDREQAVRSIEKSRRVVGTVPPIREEQDNVLDELSILDEGTSTVRETVFARSTVVKRTPPQVSSQIRVSSGSSRKKTPATDRVEEASVASRPSTSRRSKSTDPGPATPSVLPNGQPRTSSASQSGTVLETPTAAPAHEDGEDELSPQLNGSTPRVVGSEPRPQPMTQAETEMHVDELSPPSQPTPIQISPIANGISTLQINEHEPVEQTTTQLLAKRGRPRRVSEKETAEQETLPEPATAKPAKRGRPPRVAEDIQKGETPQAKPTKRGRPRKEVAVQESELQATPRVHKSDQANGVGPAAKEAEVVDELSPYLERTPIHPPKSTTRKKDVVEISSADEDSDASEEPEVEELEVEEPAEPSPRPKTSKPSPEQMQRVKSTTEKPPRKRQKFEGPKHAISIMRIKGSTVRGITVADTTRTILEGTIDQRLSRMAEKLQSSQDSARRKELRTEINLSLSFKESLNEKLLDLQDANDLLSANFKKTKLLKRDNAELRKEILSLQDSRQEIAIEHDNIQARYDAEKAEAEARNTLSDNMFEIEAAIKNGRDKARKEGRENEGPQIPLGMLLETVGNDVASRGGGLLANIKGLNRLLERAAGWLEGRA
ncbi:hypothetical protein AA0119_g4750 [Alternaria tenuissima]|uniref:Inner kinetochore subunit AME1 domain-containing protein n=1 Tax=Alternaria tenuissima TaxID=119927 RepID=A0ABY0GD18_9PLEO|nr:hypothetical protein AA0119_g4750 [Alternaria tenuissima]